MSNVAPELMLDAQRPLFPAQAWRRLAQSLELAPGVAIYATDRQGDVWFWNRACEQLYGIMAGQALGQPLDRLLHFPQHQPAFDAAMAQVHSAAGVVPASDWLVESCTGQRCWVRACFYPLPRSGAVQGVVGIAFDISQLHETHVQLEHAMLAFEHSPDAILVMDADYRVRQINPAVTRITGAEAPQIIGHSLASLGWDAGDGFYERMWAELEHRDHWDGEVVGTRSDGQHYPVRVALRVIRDANGDVASTLAVLSDISARKRAEEEVRHQAQHDALTGLPNRVLFLDRLHQALETWRRQHDYCAVMFLDLDRFKAINDTWGHAAGDMVLREVANRLRACVRRVDTISRLGGDEFVVLLADIKGADQAAHVAATVIQAILRPIQIEGAVLTLSVSIGIALCPDDGDQVDTLLHHADVAMYHAKQGGRNQFQFFDPAMNAHVIERVELENSLRQAMANDEFRLIYQPEVAVDTGQVMAVEALLRWQHPQRGLLSPPDFLQVAEDSGLIVPIGTWVLHQACRQARRWHDQGLPVTVVVNVSVAQLAHDGLLAAVEGALRAASLPAHALALDIAESALSKGGEGLRTLAQALAELGVQLTVDRFGAGLSSLELLRSFPLTKLKIDRSYLADVGHDPVHAAMVPAIITVARSLRLRVVGEGVETADQLAFLRQHGCDDYQGFYATGAGVTPNLAGH